MDTVKAIGIIGWSAKKNGRTVVLNKACCGDNESLTTDEWLKVVEFLTQDFGISLNVVWDLEEFADAVLALSPKEMRSKLESDVRAEMDGVKIFHIPDKWFGVTYTKHLNGNFYQPPVENNFFGLQDKIPDDYPTPENAEKVEAYGNELIGGLARMGIKPDKLTSLVGIWEGQLKQYKLPTVYSNDAISDASKYCEYMMNREWRSAYKLGYFRAGYHYDLRGAYPYFVTRLPDTDKCHVKFSTNWLRADWAICKAEVDVIADKTPIVYDTDDGGHILPLGKRTDIFTKEELLWLRDHKVAHIKFIDGYFFKWLNKWMPYYKPVINLYRMRDTDDKMVAHIARRIAQGISGKLDQSNFDGSYGDFYNPVLAAITRSRCRLAVGDFIWNNNLMDDLIAVQVDGVFTTKKVALNGDNGIGSWRLDAETPMLVLGKGDIWHSDKRPMGLSKEEVIEAFQSHPRKSSYSFENGSKIDFAEMQESNDRIYERFPTCGGEAMSRVTDSKPIKL